ncbi:hypothetical protein AG1IA_01366 [Rhizoctonia solani AG-1 IA]|uniref:Histone H1 n=1 Tax=Thanatephorus cucumeris (strain AG1-IA) TaxID=983506 RepID=L8X7J9_THACA|nr:hypothetical protein AG1IA_01366 [Rhizoctonia solani AG-1 IA]
MPSTKTVAAKGAKTGKSKAEAKSKAAAAGHPSFIDMITVSGIGSDCIIENKEDSRSGVSRPTIKKFVIFINYFVFSTTDLDHRFIEEKYKIEMTGLQLSNLNRAITKGAENNVFTLPKGPSGKVKLAPKASKSESKENDAPKKAATTEKVEKKAAPKATKAKTTKASSSNVLKPKKNITSAAPPKGVKAAPVVKKTSTSAAKKAPVKATSKATTTKKAPAKAPTVKKAASKKVTSGDAKKADKAKAAATKSTKASTASKSSKSKALSKSTTKENTKPASTKPTSTKAAAKPTSAKPASTKKPTSTKPSKIPGIVMYTSISETTRVSQLSCVPLHPHLRRRYQVRFLEQHLPDLRGPNQSLPWRAA